ncbi:MAG: M48 family metalloprotease [Candidatus Omnitrophica bacterium]|nr:M48 family metalloprotease [Candidatus Omnitrophota bacterium]
MAYGPKDSDAKKYSAVKFRILIADILLSLGAVLFFWIFASEALSQWVSARSSSFFVSCFLYISAFLVFMYLVSFPLHFFSSFVLEKKFGLSERSFLSWLKDEAKAVTLSFILYITCAEVFYLVLRAFPGSWWIVVSSLWVLFSVVLARLLPVLIVPLFYKYTPVEEEELKEAIFELSGKAGIPLTDVLKIDLSSKTRKANAALVGLGGTRRVVLGDTLISAFPLDEVRVVVAHEFGHLKYRHIWKLLAFSAITAYLGFYLLYMAAAQIAAATGAPGVDDLSLFPALVLLMGVFGFAVLPVQNLFSRILEKQSDRFALELTGNAKAFVGAMERLAGMNLAEKSPALLKKIFFYDHPPIAERIEMAVSSGNRKA